MLNVYPDYYKEFKCINNKCTHNCCIGWEIDIDEKSYLYYKAIEGEFGSRINENICHSDTPYFILGKDERCPFLNKDNLCDIIITLGENCICDICKEHPRFHNELPDRIESGLGLCCEEAARLILTHKNPVRLIYDGETDYDDTIIDIRDKIISILQNRDKTITDRITDMYSVLSLKKVDFDIEYYIDLLYRLERMDSNWTDILKTLKNNINTIDSDNFKIYINDREIEYEQLLVYIIYRYFANSEDSDDMKVNIIFADFVYNLIYYIGACIYTLKSEFTLNMQVQLLRLFSCEIEYSDENINIIKEQLRKEYF